MATQWARKYDKCTKCGTVETLHHANGLCSQCYMTSYHQSDQQKAYWVSNKVKQRRYEYVRQDEIKLAHNEANKKWRKQNKDYFKAYFANPAKKLKQRIAIKLYKKTPRGRMYRINYDHLRRPGITETDITPEWLVELYNTTKICVLCNVKLSNDVIYPNGKHLDHIHPLCRGGKHTRSNVRYICANCNVRLGGIESGITRRLRSTKRLTS